MRNGTKAMLAAAGILALTITPVAADASKPSTTRDLWTEFTYRGAPARSDEARHYDLCDSRSPSFQNNQALMRAMGLQRFPGPAHNRLARGMVADTIEDGIIVAMEKGQRRRIRAEFGIHERYLKSFAEAYQAGNGEIETRDRFLQSSFSHPKPIYVSHIYTYRERNSCSLYSVYPESRMCAGRKPAAQPGFIGGIDALASAFDSHVKPALTSGRFTHVMFMAMGWHNDQQVSLCRYNAISEATQRASKAMKRPFKPYIVGVTWPSAWFSASPVDFIDTAGHLGSVFNKADDADEVGYLVGNLIANRLIPLANPHQIPSVALGHSFGTRIINRSVFSRDLLRGGPVGSGPKLTIALQPAHSIFRFLPRGGVEGHPFVNLDGLDTVLVATSSVHDTANPLAIWSRYVGGRGGLATARNETNRPWVDLVRADKPLEPHEAVAHTLRQMDASPDKPIIVDASSFVFQHNDVMSDDMGRFVAGLIDKYAPAR
ncbi:MAG: hypothetical protein Q8K28_00300 [Hoeflea sp.]|uniref:hypothetical protein n=1 Tax=Hoeflea sp. TaxID=1940281 RepID=UPI0027306EB2|nr:hypothetical protein [Hoeflea sp.]MDP2118321.1 hypothetical protein [Hoeflea sp.]